MNAQTYSDENTSSKPKIDVVIVNFNAGNILCDCVGSALQSNLTARVTVVDNMSTDRSLETMLAFHGEDCRTFVYRNTYNAGFARASNIAAVESDAPYLLFLNPDCIVMPGTLERLVKVLDERPSYGMCGCLIRDPNGHEQSGSRRVIPDPWISLGYFLSARKALPEVFGLKRLNLTLDPLPSAPMEVEAISGALMLVRRTALADVGMLDDGYFLHCEDLDWFVRFRQRGWAICFVPDVYATHYKGVCSATHPLRVQWHKHRSMVRFFRKFQSQNHTFLFNWLVISGIWLHFSLALMRTALRKQIGKLPPK